MQRLGDLIIAHAVRYTGGNGSVYDSLLFGFFFKFFSEFLRGVLVAYHQNGVVIIECRPDREDIVRIIAAEIRYFSGQVDSVCGRNVVSAEIYPLFHAAQTVDDGGGRALNIRLTQHLLDLLISQFLLRLHGFFGQYRFFGDFYHGYIWCITGRTIQKCHDLRTGAALIRRESSGRRACCDTLHYCPANRIPIIGACQHIGKGCTAAYRGTACIAVQEGHHLCTGDRCIGVKGIGACPAGDVVCYCPLYSFIIIGTGRNVCKGVASSCIRLAVCPPEEGHCLSAGTGFVRGEFHAAGACGNIIFDRPVHGIFVVSTLRHIAEPCRQCRDRQQRSEHGCAEYE